MDTRTALRITLPFVGCAAAWQHWIWPTLILAAVWVCVCWSSETVIVVQEEDET